MIPENGPTRKNQVIVIGLEATEPALVEKWASEGHLPNLQRLRQQGSWRRLTSTTEISSGATWASLITGTNPAKHAMGFYHRQLKPGTYTLRKKYADETATGPFWNTLSRHGKRVAILDIPDSYVTDNLNGIMMVGWGAATGCVWGQGRCRCCGLVGKNRGRCGNCMADVLTYGGYRFYGAWWDSDVVSRKCGRAGGAREGALGRGG